MFTFLQGKKTYIIATLMTLVGVVNLVTEPVSLSSLHVFLTDPWVLVILNGLGFGALRAAVGKV